MPNGGGVVVRLAYKKIRDVSTPEEEENSAITYVAIVPAIEILKVGTEGNLRDYIPDHPGKRRSMVHKSIGNTIRNKPDRFSQLNSGFLIGASKVKIDDQKKEVSIWDGSVNNGAQSRGEIALYLKECEDRGDDPNEFHVRAEISVEPDSSVRTEIAIARNTATRVESLSQAGKRGYFDELDEAFRKTHQTSRLARSETDIGDEFVDTRLLLQVLWAMMPGSLMPSARTTTEARMRAYKNAAQCLADFEKDYLARDSDHGAMRRYEYFCDMAGEAWRVYRKWRSHPDWEDKYLRSDAKQVRRKNEVIIVADGITFPLLAALSNFVKKSADGHWHMDLPPRFKDVRLIEAARRQLKQHQGSPVLMGRSGAAYEALMGLTEMVNEMAKDYADL